MGAAATSIGSWNSKSFPRMYCPDTLIPNRPREGVCRSGLAGEDRALATGGGDGGPGTVDGRRGDDVHDPRGGVGPVWGGARPGRDFDAVDVQSVVEMRSKELKRWEGMRPPRLSMIVRSAPRTPRA